MYITKVSYLCCAKLTKLFDMKWNEFIKIAEAHGYRLVKHGKKHDCYYTTPKLEIKFSSSGTALKRFAKAW